MNKNTAAAAALLIASAGCVAIQITQNRKTRRRLANHDAAVKASQYYVFLESINAPDDLLEHAGIDATLKIMEYQNFS